MDKSSKSDDMTAVEADVEFEKAVDEMAKALIEETAVSESELESADVFAERIRAELHKEMGDFRNSFLRGYEILLEEIASKFPEDKEKLPPGAIKL